MNTEEWKLKLETLKTFGKIKISPWASEEEISLFEARYGIRLPKQYREWLQFSDGGILFPPAGLQLYGVAHKPVICLGDEDRPDEHHVVVGTMCYGDPVVFEKESERFKLYNHEAQRIEPEEVFPDFTTFLEHLPSLLGLEE